MLRLPRAGRRPADAPRGAGGPPRASARDRPACRSEPPVALAAAGGGAGARRSARGSRPSSSSTGAATAPSCCARPAGRASTAADCDVCAHPPPAARRRAPVPLLRREPAGARPLPRVRRTAARRWASGTERVEAEVAERFPAARVARLDRDAATTAERLTELLARFARAGDRRAGRHADGGQGPRLPGRDAGVRGARRTPACSLPDFRAAERTFQLLTQVSGRAGRGKEPGRVLVQTYNPEAERGRAGARSTTSTASPSTSWRWREALAWPPFSRLVAVRIEGEDPARDGGRGPEAR